MDDADDLDKAFASGAKFVNIHRFGNEYEATLSSFRDLEADDGLEHFEHAAVKGKGPTAAAAVRDALTKLRPAPMIEVREIKVVNGRKIVPLALAESTTRIKGLHAVEPVIDGPAEESPAPEPETAA